MKFLIIKLILMLLFIVLQSNNSFANEINIGANSKMVINTYKEKMTTVNHIILSPIKESLFERSKPDVINHITNIVKKVNDGRIFETFDGGKNWYEISEQKIEDLSFRVFPNPATEYIEISSTSINPTVNRRVDETAEIKIYNTLGECVNLTPHPSTGSGSGNLRVDVSHLHAGAYYITILTDDNKMINYRFVKK